MVPKLVIGSSRSVDTYIKAYLKEQQIAPSYVFEFRPDPYVIKIAQIRAISVSAASSIPGTAIIIYNFDTARPETQNAFLKTLEDRADKVLFILTARNEFSLLPTILSRVEVVNLKKELKIVDTARLFVDNQVPLGQKLEMTDKISLIGAVSICDGMLQLFEKALVSVGPEEGKKVTVQMREIIKTRDLILKVNLSPSHALDHLIFMIERD